ncbi:MAG: hypothetical protein CML17_01200 [Pusillimonas sp.]|jgi:hypothetical protein|nr:hypothetical protein [Pusillimonas sp.]
MIDKKLHEKVVQCGDILRKLKKEYDIQDIHLSGIHSVLGDMIEDLVFVQRMRIGIANLTKDVEGMSTGYKKPILKALKEMAE